MTRLALALAGLVLSFAASGAQAEDYPARPIRIVVGYAPGSASDITVRVIGPKLSQFLGQPVVIENRPGNGSNTAAEFVARAPHDGYTLLSGSVANAIRNATVAKPTFDLIKDFAPISLIGTVPVMLAAHPSLGVKNAQQLIALAKSKPNELFYGSSGVGTAAHLAGELFNVSAGVKLVHVPYPGSSQALTDVLTGRIQLTFSSVSTTMPQVEDSKLVAIGVAERERVALAPDLPTLAEQGLTDFEATIWSGLMAPAGTPQEILDKLARATDTATASADAIAALRGQGITMRGGGPEPFRRYLESEIEKWHAVGLAAGMMALAAPAMAEDYPARTVTLIVPYPAGGGVDIAGRLVAQKLTAALGQQVIVENRPGAGAVIGVRSAAKAPPDGYTLVMLVTGMGLSSTAGYDLAKDFAPISTIASIPIVVMSHPSVPAKSIKEVIELAKKEPGKVTVGTPPSPTLNYFGAENFKAVTGTDITVVTYKGTGPLTNDLVGGHVMLAFNTLPPAIGNIQAGKLTAIAVAAPERLAALPDMPTVSQSGLPGFDIVQYYGLAAPAGTPAPIVARLNKEVRALVASDDFRTRMIADGGGPMASTPEDYAANIVREEGKWGAIVKKLGLKVE